MRRLVPLALSVVLVACGGSAGDTIPFESTTTTSSTTTTAPTTTTTSTTTTTMATTTTAAPDVECFDTPPPVDMGFDPFYEQWCDALGIPVLASSRVSPVALRNAAEIVVGMIGHRPDIIEAMLANGLRVGVIGESELTTDLPEYADLYEQFPGTDWNTRARGLGATPFIPLSSVGEENVGCYPSDPYFNEESIMVHEFAHTIHLMGLDFVDEGSVGAEIVEAYWAAMGAGLWEDTYAATDDREYFAEGVQSYFGTQTERDPSDGIHNFVDTPEELEAYDPVLFEIIDRVFGDAELVLPC